MADIRNDAAIAERLAQAKAVEAAIQAAVREALLQHKRAGNPVVGWRDGKIEWVPPEQIPVDDTVAHLPGASGPGLAGASG
jgi:plasmid stabilization system protein ParE